MGNGSSIEPSKTVYLEINGKEEKIRGQGQTSGETGSSSVGGATEQQIVFSRHSSSRDIHELIAQASGVNRHAVISLRDKDGAHISLSPTMPGNSPSNPYKVVCTEPPQQEAVDHDAFQTVLAHVAEQLNRVFKMEELKSDLYHRLNTLEKKVEMEGLKAVEVEKCKNEISYIKDQLWNAQKKYVDFNRL
ncbi:hypothetical protein BaRGS_00018417, partial [Batillaria attramentaria]